jgi:transcriptional regulator with XRE-family HTH domain
MSAAHEKLAQMSIHEEIKRRRQAMNWSLERLAEEVTSLEGREKPLAWQTVQLWEKAAGGTAPSRKRLVHVATALGCRPEDLLFGTSSSTEPDPTHSDVTSTPLSGDEVKLFYESLTSSEQATLCNILWAARGSFPALSEKLMGDATWQEESSMALHRVVGLLAKTQSKDLR